MNCTCRGPIADRCRSCQDNHWDRWRMNNNTLIYAANNRLITAQQWCEYVARYEVDDLHRLLEQETS